jgi:hypothetical protein
MNQKEIVKLIDKTLDNEDVQYEKKVVDEFFEQSASYKLTYKGKPMGELNVKSILALCNQYMGLTPDQVVRAFVIEEKNKIDQDQQNEILYELFEILGDLHSEAQASGLTVKEYILSFKD